MIIKYHINIVSSVPAVNELFLIQNMVIIGLHKNGPHFHVYVHLKVPVTGILHESNNLFNYWQQCKK
jgi:hypothetical protein